MLFYILLSVAALLAGVFLSLRKRQKFEEYSIKLTLTISVAAAILVFPYFRQDMDRLLSVLESIRYGLQIIAIDFDPEVIDEMVSAGRYFGIYKALLYIFYVLAPIFGSVTILSFSKSLVDNLRMRCSKNIHIFSSLNANSISIAEYIRQNDKHAKIVFFNWQSSENSIGRRAKEADAILPKYGLKKLHFRKNKKYTFYQIDENSSANLNGFIKNYQNFKKIEPSVLENLEIKCFTDSDSIELIRKIDRFLSSQKEPLVKASFINEENTLAYRLFHDLINVIDTDKTDNEFMIIGAGEKGMSILKTALWLFDQQDMYLTIDVVDRNAQRIASELKLECPDVLNAPLDEYIYMPLKDKNWEDGKHGSEKNYMIRFYEADVNSYDFEEILRKNSVDPDFVFVTMKDDVLSQTITERMRRILARKRDDIKGCPVAIHITNDNTYEVLTKINDTDKLYYFGNKKSRYRQLFEINSILENMSRKVHMAYLNVQTEDVQKVLNETGYYRLSNHESSLAQALTVEYRVKYILARTKDEKGSAIERIEKYLSDPVNMKTLCEMEHTRWLTYQRTEGWTRPSLKQQEAIARKYGNAKTIKDDGLLMHPANVTNEELPKAERDADEILKKLGSELGKEAVLTDYVNKDAYILERIPQIISDDLIKHIES